MNAKNSEFEELTQNFNQLTAWYEQVSATNSQLQEDILSKNESVTVLHGDIENKEAEIGSIKQQLSEALDKVSEFTSTIETLNSNMVSTEEKLKRLRKRA